MFIKVKVIIESKKENLVKVDKDHFKISLKEKAEQNLANIKVIELIANYFEIRNKNVRIISGHHRSNKILEINLK